MTHADLIRSAYPRVLAKVLAYTRRLPDAEDAVQEAVARALAAWPASGAPDAPEAWLYTVAVNAHRDRARAARWERPEVDGGPEAGVAPREAAWRDELLRLVFACCDPALAPGEGAALCLATVLGLSNREVAAAFGVAPRSMEQRLARARRRLRELPPRDGVAAEDAPARLDAVLRAIYLLFNEGYWAIEGESPIRADLCRLAIGLAESIADAFPDEPEVVGLLALVVLHDARRPARLDAAGQPIPLPDQDRTRWNGAQVARGLALADRLVLRGPFSHEAAISAVHARAARAHDTDWERIASLYGSLERIRPTPAVRVNRAFAEGRARGPAAGLALLDGSEGDYPYAHAVRGALLAEAGRVAEARESWLAARAVARNAAERAQIDAKLAALRPDATTRPPRAP